MKKPVLCLAFCICVGLTLQADDMDLDEKFAETLEQIANNRSSPEVLKKLLPNVCCSFEPSVYEKILMTQLRDRNTTITEFRGAANKIAEILVNKVIACLPTNKITIETPVSMTEGESLERGIEIVSIMRSGDALVETFVSHFPEAHVNKILVQRDEQTAEPHFIYKKFSPTIAAGNSVIITEPMLATGGTLELVISLLKEQGVKEENIIIACVCAAPEGLLYLNQQFPKIKFVMNTLDEKLNEKKYIVPGLGDFGDRFFGTVH